MEFGTGRLPREHKIVTKNIIQIYSHVQALYKQISAILCVTCDRVLLVSLTNYYKSMCLSQPAMNEQIRLHYS